jgi:hypothetical protein
MYDYVPLQARVDGRVGPVPKQYWGETGGRDPLSPLLFGMFIDELEVFMRQRVPDS